VAMKFPAHPGRLIKADLDTLNLSVAGGALALGISRGQLHRIVSGRSSISAEMALRLEAVIGGSADHWLRLQSAYDLARVRNSEHNPAIHLESVQAPDQLQTPA